MLKVVLIGMGVVFAGLLLLILSTLIMSALVKPREGDDAGASSDTDAIILKSSDIPTQATDGLSHEERLVVVSAAIAQYLGTDLAGIRIKSIKIHNN